MQGQGWWVPGEFLTLSHLADPRWSREGLRAQETTVRREQAGEGNGDHSGGLIQATERPQEISKRDHLMAVSKSPPSEDELSPGPCKIKGPGGHSS